MIGRWGTPVRSRGSEGDGLGWEVSRGFSLFFWEGAVNAGRSCRPQEADFLFPLVCSVVAVLVGVVLRIRGSKMNFFA